MASHPRNTTASSGASTGSRPSPSWGCSPPSGPSTAPTSTRAIFLRTLPTTADHVLQGPGENAGIVDLGGDLALTFKIESHNHPSFIEPFQGAATGVGGILRDIFTMGARPIAVLDSLRFGDADEPRTRRLIEGVVSGIGWYGNCFGVPNLGGEVNFAPEYGGNPLVNAMAVGLVRKDRIFRARAEGVGNPVFYVGAKTGRDGIHGATMASATFEEGAEARRPTVQVGDPFTEKLLLEACLEAMATGAILGIQDMGAAGLACACSEMPARAGTGMEVELTMVPQRETGMTPYEIMLSESQERMLLVAAKGREDEIRRAFAKWELDAVEIGVVTGDGLLRVKSGGRVVAEVPVKALADEAPGLCQAHGSARMAGRPRALRSARAARADRDGARAARPARFPGHCVAKSGCIASTTSRSGPIRWCFRARMRACSGSRAPERPWRSPPIAMRDSSCSTRASAPPWRWPRPRAISP